MRSSNWSLRRSSIVVVAFIPCMVMAQVFSVPPSAVNGNHVDMEYDSAAIRSQGIGRVMNYYCGQDKDVLRFVVQFDPRGLPVSLIEGEALLQQQNGAGSQHSSFGRQWIGCRSVTVEYDDQGRLVRLYQQRWEEAFSREEVMAHVAYDDAARRFTVSEEQRTIYRPGYRYRGGRFVNDTSVTTMSGSYDDHMWRSHQMGDTTITVARRCGSARTVDGCIPLYNGDSTVYEWKDGHLARNCHLAKDGSTISCTRYGHRQDGLIEAERDENGNLRYRWAYFPR